MAGYKVIEIDPGTARGDEIVRRLADAPKVDAFAAAMKQRFEAPKVAAPASAPAPATAAAKPTPATSGGAP